MDYVGKYYEFVIVREWLLGVVGYFLLYGFIFLYVMIYNFMFLVIVLISYIGFKYNIYYLLVWYG